MVKRFFFLQALGITVSKISTRAILSGTPGTYGYQETVRNNSVIRGSSYKENITKYDIMITEQVLAYYICIKWIIASRVENLYYLGMAIRDQSRNERLQYLRSKRKRRRKINIKK